MKRLILEVSLKPFHEPCERAVRSVVQGIFRQWDRLIRQARDISFLLWTADGSELLDYRGSLDDSFEWAKWIGIANQGRPHGRDSGPRTLHSCGQVYRNNLSPMTYGRLKAIVSVLKSETIRAFGKTATVGTTFDPGPEFAESSFKYARHPEICKGNIMGARLWVHCAAVLHGDTTPYAAFPDGIAGWTSLGTFLGCQAKHFAADLDFDYIWFSNGFGYSLDSWNTTGEIFNGREFDVTSAPRLRSDILQFWKDFRSSCPELPIETRGSNLSTGMDLSSDASPVRDIYRGGFNLVAPVNSPWAALNGDYGLELVGWLSHIAELPETDVVPFRYYLHDPWWMNSPWLDRYGREPHDIYLPLSCARIRADGTLQKPDSLALLTIDNSYGEMPDVVPSETTPHFLRAIEDFPDEPGLVTWIYPFEEYHEWTFKKPERIGEVFFGDWFMRGAVNQGFPLNTVVSTENFLEARMRRPALFQDTILTCPAPGPGSPLAAALLDHLQSGGKVLLYGPLKDLDSTLSGLLQIRHVPPISGTMDCHFTLAPDSVPDGRFPLPLIWREHLCGGGADLVLEPAISTTVNILSEVGQGNERRLFALENTTDGGGRIAWVRGALSADVPGSGSQLPTPDNPEEYFTSERMMRWILAVFGWTIRFRKPSLGTTDPLILASRKRNAWYFSGFSPSTNVLLEWNSPHGVPVPVGCDVVMSSKAGSMVLARAWHKECRVFVRQDSGEVTCREQFTGELGVNRRLYVGGLSNASLTFLPDSGVEGAISITLNDAYLGQGTPVPHAGDPAAKAIQVDGITGDILISW